MTRENWLIPSDHMQLIRELLPDGGSASFVKPRTAFGNKVEFRWHERIIVRDFAFWEGEGATYEIAAADKRNWRDPEAQFELRVVDPANCYKSSQERRHPDERLFNPQRPLLPEDLRRLKDVILLIPAQRAHWWAKWGKPSAEALAKSERPLTDKLAVRIFRRMPRSQIRTLEQRKEAGLNLAMAQIAGLVSPLR